MTSSAYTELQARKRKWTPVAVDAGKLLEGGEEVVQRGLALRCLEIPVGDFISEAMKGDLPDVYGCKELLLSNVQDEINHDIALDFAAQAHRIPDRFEKEAAQIKKAWLELDRHPVLKAVVLERSVFFVLLPFFRFNGDMGIRTVASDISRDEQTHTLIHAMVAHDLGEKTTPALDKLRKATVHWAMDQLGVSSNKYLNKDFWLKASDNLYHQGKATELAETQRARMPAFFESSNINLPQYG